jgi:hypothetical protein
VGSGGGRRRRQRPDHRGDRLGLRCDKPHGIFRDLPGLRTSALIEVSSPDAPDAFAVSTAGTPRIRIGDPDRTVSGLQRYVLTYTVDGV